MTESTAANLVLIKPLTTEDVEQVIKALQALQLPYKGRTKAEITSSYPDAFNNAAEGQLILGNMIIHENDEVVTLTQNPDGANQPVIVTLIPFKDVPDDATYGSFVSKDGTQPPPPQLLDAGRSRDVIKKAPGEAPFF